MLKKEEGMKHFVTGFMVAAQLSLASGRIAAGGNTTEGKMYLDGEFWKRQAMNDLMPYWYEHVRDKEHGGFYLNLSRNWQPIPPWDKMPAMISRQVFSFSAAYLLSGEEKYLEVAREGVDYLLEHGWDREYGGWLGVRTQVGTPRGETKEMP